MMVIYSVGHSNRSLQEFISILSHYAVLTVIDVRSHPHSLANPHFNKEVLEYELPRSSIQYCWVRGEGLGGSKTSDVERFAKHCVEGEKFQELCGLRAN